MKNQKMRIPGYYNVTNELEKKKKIKLMRIILKKTK